LLYVEDNPANLMLVEDLVARRPDFLYAFRTGVRCFCGRCPARPLITRH
jgi:hypothetical protein